MRLRSGKRKICQSAVTEPATTRQREGNESTSTMGETRLTLTDLSDTDCSYILDKLSFNDLMNVRLSCKTMLARVMAMPVKKGIRKLGVIVVDFKKELKPDVFNNLDMDIRIKLPYTNHPFSENKTEIPEEEV